MAGWTPLGAFSSAFCKTHDFLEGRDEGAGGPQAWTVADGSERRNRRTVSGPTMAHWTTV